MIEPRSGPSVSKLHRSEKLGPIRSQEFFQNPNPYPIRQFDNFRLNSPNPNPNSILWSESERKCYRIMSNQSPGRICTRYASKVSRVYVTLIVAIWQTFASDWRSVAHLHMRNRSERIVSDFWTRSKVRIRSDPDRTKPFRYASDLVQTIFTKIRPIRPKVRIGSVWIWILRSDDAHYRPLTTKLTGGMTIDSYSLDLKIIDLSLSVDV